jgi:hypothetical protein
MFFFSKIFRIHHHPNFHFSFPFEREASFVSEFFFFEVHRFGSSYLLNFGFQHSGAQFNFWLLVSCAVCTF